MKIEVERENILTKPKTEKEKIKETNWLAHQMKTKAKKGKNESKNGNFIFFSNPSVG